MLTKAVVTVSAHKVFGGEGIGICPLACFGLSAGYLLSVHVPILLEHEQEYVRKVVGLAAGNKSRKAVVLGTGRVSLLRKPKKHNKFAACAPLMLQKYSGRS
jgi:hypothetical protein